MKRTKNCKAGSNPVTHPGILYMAVSWVVLLAALLVVTLAASTALRPTIGAAVICVPPTTRGGGTTKTDVRLLRASAVSIQESPRFCRSDRVPEAALRLRKS
jgi:hypothetical protein